MAFDPELLDLMPHTFTVAPLSGRDFYARSEQYGAGVAVRGYWQESGETISTTEGEQVTSASVAFLRADTVGIAQDSRITLPNGATPPILKVENLDDGDGTQYVTVVHFGG